MREKISKNLDILSIICFVLSVIVLATNLFGRLNSIILTCIGCLLSISGMIFLFYDIDREKHKPLRGFKVVNPDMRKTISVHMPTRSSKHSAGYDFYADKDYDVVPNEIIKIWTDIKAYMQPNEFLMLDVRSSMGGKYMLANTIGIVDSDYYENPDNDGNICIMLKNISNTPLKIYKGDKIAQAIFMEYLKADNDNTKTKRKGGFGSSGR